MKRGLILILIILVLILISGCGITREVLNCSDGTVYNSCSKDNPYYCFNGSLIKNASFCGCPYDYKADSNDCKRIQRCSDNTIYNECSETKPLYCLNGNLINKASKCGCSDNDISKEDICVSKYLTGEKNINLKYYLHGKVYYLDYEVYDGLKNHLLNLERAISYSSIVPTDKDFALKFLDEPEQKKILVSLIDEIKKLTSNKDDQARIAISLVQQIPYDFEGFYNNNLVGRYPYEVLYDQKGVCGEKSQLLAFILRELNYGVVLFSYEIEQHESVGIKCPIEYSYQNSGYCFIETTSSTIITDVPTNYIGFGKLNSNPEIIPISEGYSFDTITEEYEDAQRFKTLNILGNNNDGYLGQRTYYEWLDLVEKYGIETS